MPRISSGIFLPPKMRRIIRDDTDKTLQEDYDIILMPTTPTTAFKLGEKIKDPIEMYLADIFTVQANLTGLPAINVPLFKHSNGLPIGMQFMANRFREDLLMSVTDYVLKNYKKGPVENVNVLMP